MFEAAAADEEPADGDCADAGAAVDEDVVPAAVLFEAAAADEEPADGDCAEAGAAADEDEADSLVKIGAADDPEALFSLALVALD